MANMYWSKTLLRQNAINKYWSRRNSSLAVGLFDVATTYPTSNCQYQNLDDAGYGANTASLGYSGSVAACVAPLISYNNTGAR
ncbi:hypothetical protein OH492_13025 [Vibrio chagasii]|nr:hypothetical protein [Vibrio chagasii]